MDNIRKIKVPSLAEGTQGQFYVVRVPIKLY